MTNLFIYGIYEKSNNKLNNTNFTYNVFLKKV